MELDLLVQEDRVQRVYNKIIEPKIEQAKTKNDNTIFIETSLISLERPLLKKLFKQLNEKGYGCELLYPFYVITL